MRYCREQLYSLTSSYLAISGSTGTAAGGTGVETRTFANCEAFDGGVIFLGS